MSFMDLGRIGKTDRIIRGIAGAAVLAVAFLAMGGALQIILLVLGGILLVEGIIGFCPLTYVRRRSANKRGA